jgi:hypothetical protein
VKGKYHIEDGEVHGRIIFEMFLIVIRWTRLKVMGLIMGFCECGN